MFRALKSIEPFSLSFHDDADGVYSASMLMYIFKIRKVEESYELHSPPFNEYTDDVALDLGYPTIETETKIVIDHHPGHERKTKYKLYFDKVPTGLIIWNHLKDYIPETQWWRVVGALIGDGQVELVPDEIWDLFPQLTDEKGILYQSRGNYYVSKYPLYVYLSSGVNALCRLGNPLQALMECLNWKTPIDAVLSETVKEAKELLRVEANNILNQKPVIEVLKNKVIISRIKTTRPEFGMSGYVASKLSAQYKFHTVVVINDSNGEVSIRGVLAKYIANKLTQSGFKAGGHPGYCGATVPIEEIESFIKTLRTIIH